MGVIVWAAVDQGESFRGSFLGWGKLLWAHCSGGKMLKQVIVQEEAAQRRIIQGHLSGRQKSWGIGGENCPGGGFHG